MGVFHQSNRDFRDRDAGTLHGYLQHGRVPDNHGRLQPRSGSYQGEGGKLTVEIGPVTAAACPPESRSEQFLKLLSGGALYFFRDGNLYIDLFADGGTMIFAPGVRRIRDANDR